VQRISDLPVRGVALSCVVAIGGLSLIALQPSRAQAAKDETILVSRATGAAGAKGNADSHQPAISGNGRFVAFVSSATNLSSDDPDAGSDVFVRDLRRNTTILVSRASGAGGAKGDGDSGEPSISRDGRFVAFSSGASNLVPSTDGTTAGNVFVRDLRTDTTTLVSRDQGPGGAPVGGSDPSISADGSSVAFSSAGLPPILPRLGHHVLVRNLLTDVTTDVAGGELFTEVGLPSISGDGTAVAWMLFVQPTIVFLNGDIVARLAAQDVFYSAPSLSWDANRLAYVDATFDAGHAKFDVFVRDRAQETTTLASGGVEAGAGQPAIAGEGRFVAFADLYRSGQVFEYDLQTDTTALVSRASGAAGAPGGGSEPSISGTGRAVAFSSGGSNLSPDDPDALNDVFVRDVLGPPNRPPDCSRVTLGRTRLWPPNHRYATVTAAGIRDPDPGDRATLVIDAISQDEPVDGRSDANTAPDAQLAAPPSSHARVRAERSGRGDGRVYRLHYTATDTHGATCEGSATVGVPRHRFGVPRDSAPPSYNSLLP
jgi:Tol biopolymer transport system component